VFSSALGLKDYLGKGNLLEKEEKGHTPPMEREGPSLFVVG